MLKKISIGFIFILGIIFVIGIPSNYSSLIDKERRAIIYHPETNYLFDVIHEVVPQSLDKWKYIIPFSSFFYDYFYVYEKTTHSTCLIGDLTELEKLENEKIKNPSTDFNMDDWEANLDKLTKNIKEKKYRYDTSYYSYIIARGDIKIEDISNNIILSAINKIPFWQAIQAKENVKTDIDVKEIGVPIDFLLIKNKVRYKFQNKNHPDEFERKNYEPEYDLKKEAILILEGTDSFYNLRNKSYFGTCDGNEEYFYSDS